MNYHRIRLSILQHLPHGYASAEQLLLQLTHLLEHIASLLLIQEIRIIIGLRADRHKRRFTLHFEANII
jgi:hypothetical protein